MSNYIKKDENGFWVFDEIEFSKTLPSGLEYFAVDGETEQIYNLGFNYKDKMEKQIADLETKLAESESELEKQKEKYDKLYGCYKKTSSEDLQYKYHLAEENEQLKQQLAEYVKINDVLHSVLSERCMKCEEEHNQDKISFAVERLEKVKEVCSQVWGMEYAVEAIEDYIDNQIRQLKEGK